MGVIAFAEDNVIAPSLHENLPRETDAVLVDESGEVIYPTDRARAADGSDWSRAIELAAGGRLGHDDGAGAGAGGAVRVLARQGAARRFAVVFSWPWRTLTANLKQQAFTLGGFLLFGLVLAGSASIALSAYLARPLQVLGEGATRIARGERVPASQMPRAAGDRGGRGARRGLRAHGDVDPEARPGAARRRGAARAARGATARASSTAAQQALVEAERFAAMGKTSAAIAHELKNTLNGLGMAVELIVQEPTNTARVARLHPQVAREIARLRDVVDSLLSFSRVPRIERARADLAGRRARRGRAARRPRRRARRRREHRRAAVAARRTATRTRSRACSSTS